MERMQSGTAFASTEDCGSMEKELIKAFAENFSLAEGNEYFRVPCVEKALELFDNIVMSHRGKEDEFMSPLPQESPSLF
ncbi:hypothetical protein GMAR_ORF76 [Golden Marseillevirus]|uniref:hypothetical protein n=1 Tax=Golden Marseillevirus TaxID=1720526 RepID=UPI000877AC8C|nr:hypothetical protein GMAR_ORF76 [Golden Marseillevirus]ALX27451.1 hypothetical protein GMAR_ORF76 [Golden Marseillevirus]